jgi:hypothetical protein
MVAPVAFLERLRAGGTVVVNLRDRDLVSPAKAARRHVRIDRRGP